MSAKMSAKPSVAWMVIGLLALGGCATTSPEASVSATSSTTTASAAGSDALRAQVAKDMPSLIANSDAVVIATAVSSRIHQVEGGVPEGQTTPVTFPETWTRIQVTTKLKGDPATSIKVAQLGSASGDVENGAPLLEKGKTYLLFLTKGSVDGYVVTDATTMYEKKGETFVRTGTDSAGATIDIPQQISTNEAATLVTTNNQT